MNDIEREWKQLPRTAPSTGLDDRIRRTLTVPAPLLARPVPLWACGLAALLGLLAGTLRPASPPTQADAAPEPVRLVVSASLPDSPFIGRTFTQP